MSKKHLTYNDRLAIQAGLQEGLKVAQITKDIGKDRTTTGREIRAHRRSASISNGNSCVHRKTCTRTPDCRSACFRGKHQYRTACGRYQEGCPNCQEGFRSDYKKSPFIRDACGKRLRCRLYRMLYDVKYAQKQYEDTLSEFRRGISLAKQELNQIDDTISPPLKKGQPLPTVYARYRAKLPAMDRIIYSYIDTGLLDARDIDLQRKLRGPEREKSDPILRVDRKCHTSRIYEDYLAHMTQNPDALVCQMDSVMIHRGGQVTPTTFLTTRGLQLMFSRERNIASSMTEISQNLRRTLGEIYSRMLFQVIVTDRGNGSTDPVRIETGPKAGTVQCRVFYCGPMNSDQRNNYERNHGLIRCVVPKGQAKEHYTKEGIREVMNHINSYPRKKWNGQAPIDLFAEIYGQEAVEFLSPRKVPSDSIYLIPTLFKK